MRAFPLKKIQLEAKTILFKVVAVVEIHISLVVQDKPLHYYTSELQTNCLSENIPGWLGKLIESCLSSSEPVFSFTLILSRWIRAFYERVLPQIVVKPRAIWISLR